MDSRDYTRSKDRSLDRYSLDKKRHSEKRSRDERYGNDYRSSGHRDKRRNHEDDRRREQSRDYRERSRERSSRSSRRSSRERHSWKGKERYQREENVSKDSEISTKLKETSIQSSTSYSNDLQQTWEYYGWSEQANYPTAEYTAEQYEQYAQYYYGYYQQQQQEIPPPPSPATESRPTNSNISSVSSLLVSKSTNGETTPTKEDISEEEYRELGYTFKTTEDPSILFEKIGQVGEGTYGKVYKARNAKTGKLMALKKIRMKTEKDEFPMTAVREIKLLQKLKHPKIVELQQILVSRGDVYMVLEYMDHDLSGILGHPDFTFQPSHAKSLVKQMLEGLAYLHNMGILHRDIKGSNLLINNKGELKIADFGLARVFEKNHSQDYTNRVITIWYRPPELLLGATVYGPAVDIWSVGCIMLEFFTGKAIFNGVDEVTQLDIIYKIMGTPNVESWPGLTDLPWYELVRPTKVYSSRFKELYGSLLPPGALELSEALLSMNPQKRPTAAEALEFPYFKTELPEPVMPANLLNIQGDWHDFESKQRKRQKALNDSKKK